ncbi:MAG TPA: hypothetical protein V6D18_17295 [Thermosynechococcaceae cyanobacterium]
MCVHPQRFQVLPDCCFQFGTFGKLLLQLCRQPLHLLLKRFIVIFSFLCSHTIEQAIDSLIPRRKPNADFE